MEYQPPMETSMSNVQKNGRLKTQPGMNRIGQQCSKSLFRRRGSLNFRKLKENTMSESCDSSLENLGGSSTGGSVEGGSTDDLDSGVNYVTQKRNKILSSIGATVNKIGSEVWLNRRNSIDSGSKTKGSKSSSESLNKSPIKSPSRTPVTENDPLGALLVDVEEKQTVKGVEMQSRNSSEIELDHSGAPVSIREF